MTKIKGGYRWLVILFTWLMAGSIASAANAVLPVIKVSYDTICRTDFNPGKMEFIYKGDTTRLDIQVRHRGSYASTFDKLSLAIKVVDANGEKRDVSFLSMRTDNYWVLDAMAVDKARMRDRVSMDLWLEFSRKPWYASLERECINGYRGEYVNVLINGRRYGVYCLKERVDRKQLKLKKIKDGRQIRGLLYKVTSYTNSTGLYDTYTTQPSDTVASWDGWELSYPDLEDGDSITWKPLTDLIDFINKSDSATFVDSLYDHVDLPVFIDYILFTDLLSARDNVIKNTYLSFYNIEKYDKVTFTPWDIDHSWGRMYDSSPEDDDWVLWDKNRLKQRLSDEYPCFDDSLAMRWHELRQTYFSIEHLDSLTAHYFDLLASTGADVMETILWNSHNGITLNIKQERQYMHDWMVRRLAILDERYPKPEDDSSALTMRKENDGSQSPFVNVYSLSGRLVSRIVRHSSECVSEQELRDLNLPKGVYLVGGRKAIVR